MSEETHTKAEQLFDSQGDEVAADNATDTNENQDGQETHQDNFNSEQEQTDGLNLEIDKAPTKAEETKLKQIKKWQDALDKGEKSLDDLPPAQSWLKNYLKADNNEAEVVDHKAIAKEIAKEALQEERQELQFADLKDSLNSMRLAKEQQSIIQEKYNLFIGKKISPFESLALAAEYAKVDFTGLTEKKRRMSIPQPSTKKATGKIDMDNTPFSELAENVPQDKINEHLRNLVK